MKLLDYVIKEHDEHECTYGYQHSIIHVRNFWGGFTLAKCTMQNLYYMLPNEPRLGEMHIVEIALDPIEQYWDAAVLETIPVELRPRSIYVSLLAGLMEQI